MVSSTKINQSAHQENLVFIGISLGTLYTNISIINQDGQVQTIADHDGERNIPTCVAFTTHDTLCGTQAMFQSIRNFRNTITQFKSLLGKSFDDPEVVKHRKLLKLNIVPHPSNEQTPAYCIQVPSNDNPDEFKESYYSPQQVMTLFLKSMKNIAESFTGQNVNGCVMSYHTDTSKEVNDAISQSAKEAGFSTVFMMKEAIAAVFAYQMLFPNETSLKLNSTRDDPESQKKRHPEKVDKKIVIADFGGHQFNVTTIQESSGLYSIHSSIDDFELGGINMDQLLATHMAVEFRRKTKMDVSENKKSMMKLMRACEQTKKMLSQRDVAPCLVESLYEGMDLNINMNRGRFEILIESMILRCREIIKKSLEAANWELNQVDQVYLIGGCCRVPRFIKMINDLWQESSGNCKIMPWCVEPDEVISQGCCCHAKNILEYGVHRYEQLLKNEPAYKNVPALIHAIRLKDQDGEVILHIPSSTPLPISRKAFLSTSVQSIHIYEIQMSVSNEEVLVGEFKDLLDWQEDIEGDEDSQAFIQLDLDANMNVKLSIENGDGKIIKEIA